MCPFLLARGGSCLFLLATLSAQAPELPRLLQLGPLPADAMATVRVHADGTRAGDVPAGATDVVLRAHPRAPAAAIVAELARQIAAGVATVHFLATVPDGRTGAFTLALPPATGTVPTWLLRAHRRRPGVPLHSSQPLLRQLCADWERAGIRSFELVVQVPGDASCQELLTLLAVVAHAGVTTAVPCIAPWEAVDAAGGTGLALDLVGLVSACIVATPAPLPPPGVVGAALGCMRRPPADAAAGATAPMRVDGGLVLHREVPEDTSRGWWGQRQLADGSYPDDRGAPDLESTALGALSLLGDGVLLDGTAGLSRPLQRSLGWLLVRQRADGDFEDSAAGSVRRHALVTWVLAEAVGSGPSGVLLRTPATNAMRWLCSARHADGGFGNSREVASDPVTTAWAVMAIAAAEHAGLAVPIRAVEVVAWFDAHGLNAPLAAAAELMARFAAGQDPEATPRMGQLVALASQVDRDDPQALFWASYALFHNGGDAWTAWQKQLTATVVRSQIRRGDHMGMWEPARGYSRIATSALHVLVLQCYYRYSRLLR